MASINLQPPYNRGTHFFTGTMTTATAKYGMVMVDGASGNFDDVKPCTSAGETKIRGVVVDRGDPNNSDLFASGATASIMDQGDAEVRFAGSTTVAIDDVIIASATTGLAKVLAAEGKPYTVLGYARQGVTTGTSPQLVSVRLQIFTVPA